MIYVYFLKNKNINKHTILNLCITNYIKNYTYKKGICPNAESLQENRIMTIPSTGAKIWNKKDMTKIISSFKKTWQEIFKQKFE